MEEYQTFSIRLPRWLYTIIKNLTDEQHRSINQQINMYIENQLKERDHENSSAESGRVTSEVVSQS